MKGVTMKKEPKAGYHDYIGAKPPTGIELFSFCVNCFQWIQEEEILKKGRIKVTIAGSMYDPKSVCDKAEEICHQLDARKYDGPKIVKV